MGKWPDVKLMVRKSISQFQALWESVGSQEHNLSILVSLLDARTEEGKLLRRAGDRQGADQAEQEVTRLEGQYRNLFDMIYNNSTEAAEHLSDAYFKGVAKGAELFNGSIYSEALREFSAEEAAMREYISLRPLEFEGYDRLRNLYDWIQLTQDKLNRSKEADEARNLMAHMAWMAAALRSTSEVPVDDELRVARQRVGQSYYEKKDFDKALLAVQEEIDVATAILKEKADDPQALYNIGNAYFGQGMVKREGLKPAWEEPIRLGIAYTEKAVTHERKNAQFWENLGGYRKYLAEQLNRDGRKAEALIEYQLAIQAYRRMIALAPHDENMLQMIRELEALMAK